MVGETGFEPAIPYAQDRCAVFLTACFCFAFNSFPTTKLNFAQIFTHQSRNERVRNVDDVPLFVVGIQEAWLENGLDVGIFQV